MALFLIAPLVSEFLLGSLSITVLSALVVLAPMYGGGALLIREASRRTGRGWPTIFLLALAFGVIEEAFATQSLFNPDYLGLGVHLLQPANIAILGIGGWWTVFVLTLHTVWSISVSIALAEALVPERAGSPWLGRFGLVLSGVLFAAGAAAVAAITSRGDRFVAPAPQRLGAALAVALLVATAFLWPRRGRREAEGAVPSPCLLGLAGLIAGSAFLLIPAGWGWWAVAAYLGLDAAVLVAIGAWSRRVTWRGAHELGLAAGAAFAYAWHAFLQTPVSGRGGAVGRAGNVLFALGLLVLVGIGARRSASDQGSQPGGTSARQAVC